MSIVETIQKSRHLGKDYNSRLELLYKESFEILQSKSAKKKNKYSKIWRESIYRKQMF